MEAVSLSSRSVPSPGGSARSGLRPGLVFGAWGIWPQGHRDAGSSLRRFSGSLDHSPKTFFFPPPGMQTLVDG